VLLGEVCSINFVSWRFARSLCVHTKRTNFAVDMLESRCHVLHAADALDAEIGEYRERLLFAVCELSRYDVIIGVRWRKNKGARINYKNNKITITHERTFITIKPTLQRRVTLSRQRLNRNLKHPTPILTVFLHGG